MFHARSINLIGESMAAMAIALRWPRNFATRALGLFHDVSRETIHSATPGFRFAVSMASIKLSKASRNLAATVSR